MSDQLNFTWRSLHQPFSLLDLVNHESWSPKITKILDIEQIYITIVPANCQINLTYLTKKRIVPAHWQTTAVRDNLWRYENGVTIASRQGEISFSERLSPQADSLKMLEVIDRYCEQDNQHLYRGVLITFKRLISLPGSIDSGLNYFQDSLLSPDLGSDLVKAKLNILYQLERCQLPLTVEAVKVRQHQEGLLPALLFTGKFKYPTAQISQIQGHLQQWKSDRQTFRLIIDQGFLS